VERVVLPTTALTDHFEQLRERLELSHQILITLLAIKKLQYVKDLGNISMVFRGTSPQEIIDNVCRHRGTPYLELIPGFDFVQATSNALWRQRMIRQIERTIGLLVYEVGTRNRHIGQVVLDMAKPEDNNGRSV
jgi:hypothetical protein